MRTTVNRRGQTAIPAEFRRRYGIEEGTQVEWLDTGAGLRVIPVPSDPIAALKGSGRGERLLERLLQERARDRAAE